MTGIIRKPCSICLKEAKRRRIYEGNCHNSRKNLPLVSFRVFGPWVVDAPSVLLLLMSELRTPWARDLPQLAFHGFSFFFGNGISLSELLALRRGESP